MSALIAELNELIELRRYVHRRSYREKNKSSREIGNYSAKLLGRGMDFSEVRNYQAGDEIRHMEWRITARTGRPHIKLYQEEKERPVMLFCDFSSSMFFGTQIALKSVIAARLAALIAWLSIAQSDRVGGFIYSEKNFREFVPRGRNSTLLPFLSALSQETQHIQKKAEFLANANHSFPFPDALDRFKRTIKPGTLIVFISDFYFLNPQTEYYLNRLTTNNPTIAYPIFDGLELSSPKPGYYPISNGQEHFLCDMTQQELWKNYQNYCDERQTYLNNFFRRSYIKEVRVTTGCDLPKIVHQTFPRRQRG